MADIKKVGGRTYRIRLDDDEARCGSAVGFFIHCGEPKNVVVQNGVDAELMHAFANLLMGNGIRKVIQQLQVDVQDRDEMIFQLAIRLKKVSPGAPILSMKALEWIHRRQRRTEEVAAREKVVKDYPRPSEVDGSEWTDITTKDGRQIPPIAGLDTGETTP